MNTYTNMLQSCKGGWYFADGACFWVSPGWGTWNDSRRLCTSLGGDLASIHNERVNNAVTKRFDWSFLWLGMSLFSFSKF